MQVSVETTAGLERRMTVEVPAERVEKEVENRLKSLSRTAKLAGFRPGKIPMNIMANKFGAKVRQEVLSEVTQSTFYEAVVQEKLEPAGRPRIEPKSVDPGANLQYTAVFEVFPIIELTALDKVKVTRPVAEITEQDIDNMLESMRKQRTEWPQVDRPAREGDRLVIDFVGTINGEGFSGNKGQQVPIVLGSKSFIEGFEQKLIGTAAGDEVAMDLQFPDDYQAKELAGKPVHFVVQVTAVAEPRLPELDEEFAKSYGIAGGTVEALRKEVSESMHRELEQALKEKTKQRVMDALYETNPFDVPKSLIQDEARNLMQQMRNTLKNQGMKAEDIPLDSAMFEDRAKRRVALGLLISDIVKKNNFTASPAAVRTTLEAIAASYDDPEEVVKWYYEDRSRLGQVETLVLEQHVVDWVIENAGVDEEKTTFSEIMQAQRS